MSVSASARQPQGISVSQTRSTTLTQVTFFARNFLIIALIFFIILLMGKLAYDGFLLYLAAQNAKRPEPVDQRYGSLPPINFPAQIPSDKPNGYFLKLTDKKGRALDAFNEPESLFTTLRVYETYSLGDGPGLNVETKIRQIAQAFGFSGEPEIVDSQIYRWNNDNGSIEVNRKTFATTYNTNYLSNNELLSQPGKTLPTNAEATDLLKSVLEQAGLLTNDVATMSADVVHVKAVGSKLERASSIGEADFIQVALYRAPVYQTLLNQTTGEVLRDLTYPIVEPSTQPSSIVGIIARNWLDENLVVQLRYVYQPVNYTKYGVYAARSPQEAWQDVILTGQAYVVNKGKSESATVTKVSLAYYESSEAQEYLQPVYVFTGENDFAAYVPAVDPSQTSL